VREKNTSKSRIGGVSAKTLAIPVLVVVAALLVSIVLMIIDINHSSNSLFDLMQQSGAYQLDAYDMQASNTVFSETCSSYIQTPVLLNSSPNVGPLMAFVGELDSDRRSPKIAERFRNYDVSYEARLCVERASEYSEQILEVQIHAIAVMSSISEYALPVDEYPALSVFSNYELTQTEIDMSKDEKIGYARSLISAQAYTQTRYYISENINRCNEILNEDFSRAQAQTKNHVTIMRNVLWGEIFAIVFILCGGFAGLYLLILKPLKNYSDDIKTNHSIAHPARTSEMKQLVNSFNSLWEYRNKIETFLRTEAENDALTGLPNRYCLERDLLEIESLDKPVAVFMFDVNFLKQTNDTKGHLAGDQLIRTVASCIKECFEIDKNNNCYRIGGDEFVALLVGCNKEEIKMRLERFKFVLTRENVSVSVGFAFDNKLESGGMKILMEKADKSMYKQKKEIHELSEKQKKD